ncbi:SIR2 family protein, partial [candidate division KSB1 bacterium]|nr:SIR2 family protein [candidate division KSB1 bacterium]
MNAALDLKFPPAALTELVQALKENRLIIVVGSGLSIPCGLPSWEKLVLELMPQWLTDWGKKDKADQIQSLKDELLLAANLWWKHVPSEEQRQKFFAAVFNPPQLKSKGFQLSENHQLLAQLPLPGILTTNYDPLLELSHSNWATNVKTQLDADLGLLLENRQPFLLKLHGTWNNLKSIILTEAQYAQLSIQAAYQFFYQSLQLHYRLLFLGYGGRDPDLEQMHRQLSQLFDGQLPDRYLLLNKPAADLKAVLNQTKACQIAEYDGDTEGHGVIKHLLRYLLEQSTGQTAVTEIVETVPDVLQVYRQFLHQNYDSIQIFQDKYFKLADIYVSLRLEYNPLLYEKLDELEFQRKCLPEEQMPRRMQEARGKSIG